jgi:YtoQ family protein
MLNVYLAGEIHSDWREEIIKLCKKENLNIKFSSPITNHEASDNCGVDILGPEEKNFWKDNKGANINSMRTKKSIKDCDVVIVKFGEKYKQWNAAFDAGYAAALNKSIIVIHNDEHQHALKEVDASAAAVAKDQNQAFRILKYILEGSLAFK